MSHSSVAYPVARADDVCRTTSWVRQLNDFLPRVKDSSLTWRVITRAAVAAFQMPCRPPAGPPTINDAPGSVGECQTWIWIALMEGEVDCRKWNVVRMRRLCAHAGWAFKIRAAATAHNPPGHAREWFHALQNLKAMFDVKGICDVYPKTGGQAAVVAPDVQWWPVNEVKEEVKESKEEKKAIEQLQSEVAGLEAKCQRLAEENGSYVAKSKLWEAEQKQMVQQIEDLQLEVRQAALLEDMNKQQLQVLTEQCRLATEEAQRRTEAARSATEQVLQLTAELERLRDRPCSGPHVKAKCKCANCTTNREQAAADKRLYRAQKKRKPDH